MKKFVLALAVVVAAAASANAQTPAPKPATKAAPASPAAPAMHAAKPMAATKAKAQTMKAEVVSTDAAAKSITVKDAAGASTTLTATGSAVAALAKVKAGDWVTVTHNDMTATHIVKAKGASTGMAKHEAKHSTKK